MTTIILIAALFLMAIAFIIHQQSKEKEIKALKESIKGEREDAVKRSKAVTRGNIAQEFVPLFPGFPYEMSDCKFSGQPLDFLIFDGMTAVRDGTQVKINVVFADVKVNKAQTTKVQKAIEEAINEGRVRFETWNIDKDKQIKIKRHEKTPPFGPYVPAPLFELKEPS